LERRARRFFIEKLSSPTRQFYNVVVATRQRLERIVRPIAFACTLIVGIAAGCIWGAVEIFEDKARAAKRTVAEKPHTGH
jgi:hypothetical protein